MQSFAKIDRYLLGDNPFIGVDHLSQERARERQNRLNTIKILDVITTALNVGAEGLSFSAHPVMYDALREMKAQGNTSVFGLYPMLPYAHKYVRAMTEKGVVGVVREILSSLSWKSKLKAIASGGVSLASMDPGRVLRTYVDTELEILLGNAPSGATLRAVLLHDTITDLLVSFEASELFTGYANHILDTHHVRPGFATRNFRKFVEFALKSGIRLDQIVIFTPFNKVGFQMNPSKEDCEATLDRYNNTNVVAMSILAAGYLKLTDALSYLREHPAIRSFIVGVSTQMHAKETFPLMRKILG